MVPDFGDRVARGRDERNETDNAASGRRRAVSQSPDEAAAAGAQAGQDPDGVRELAKRLEEPPPATDDWGFAGPDAGDEPDEPGDNMDGMNPTG